MSSVQITTNINVQEAESFLSFLDPDAMVFGEPFAFQTYDDNKARKGQARTLIGRLDQHIKTLTAANRDRYAVHVTINDTSGQARRAANVVKVRKHFVEIDGTMTRDKILKLAKAAGLTVAWINESSRGKYHVYFNIADDVGLDLSGFTRRQKQLVALFNGGKESVDLSRVLRLPGFYHRKGKPFMVRCVYTNAGAPAHSIADFQRALAGIEIDEAPNTERETAHDEDATAIAAAIDIAKSWPRAITNTDTPDGTKNKKGNSTTYDLAAELKDTGLDEATCIEIMEKHYNSTRCDPPWSFEELQTIVRNAYRYTKNAQGSKHPDVLAAKTYAADPITDADMAGINAQALKDFVAKAAQTTKARLQSSATDVRGIGDNSKNGIVFLDADKVETHNVDYIWIGRLARGKHSLIAGEAGEGKSQILCDIIARISREGSQWPDKKVGGPVPHGNCIILSAEDDPEDTLVPRLKAAGADLTRVKILTMVKGNDGKRKFSLETDIPALAEACRQLGNVVLIGIDPVSSYMGGKIQGGQNLQVRHVLDPLSDLAAELRCGILSITHFNKGSDGKKAVHRIMDSIAFGAAPRATFGAFADPTDVGEVGDGIEPRVFLLFKTNLPDKAKELKYHIIQTLDGGTDKRTGKPIKALRVEWDGDTDLTADTVQRLETESRTSPRLEEAIQFYEMAVPADEPQPIKAVNESAEQRGLKEATLRRARAKLGIMARVRDGTGGSYGPPVWEYVRGTDARGDLDLSAAAVAPDAEETP